MSKFLVFCILSVLFTCPIDAQSVQPVETSSPPTETSPPISDGGCKVDGKQVECPNPDDKCFFWLGLSGCMNSADCAIYEEMNIDDFECKQQGKSAASHLSSHLIETTLLAIGIGFRLLM